MMIRSFILSALLLAFAIQLKAQMPRNIKIQGNPGHPASLRAPCPDNNAGTITFDVANFVGQSNDIDPDTIYLCLGDTLPIIHNGDFVLNGDPNPATQAGIGYAFYDCRPTIDGPDIATVTSDPCVNQTSPLIFGGFTLPQGPDGIWLANENINGNLNLVNSGFHQEAFNMGVSAPIQLWFAPITIDNFFTQGYEAGGPCVSVSTGEAFSVVYLEPVEVTAQDPTFGAGLQGTFTVEGGLPEFDPATNYSNITLTQLTGDPITGTVQTANPGHGDVVQYTVPRPGSYELVVEDGKSCAALDTLVMPVIFGASTLNGAPGDTVCVEITVDNLVDVTNIQFTLQWDAAVLDFVQVQNLNTTLPALDDGSFNTALTGSGQLPFAWLDFLGSSNSLPDGSVLFEVCFEVIGSLGQSSPVDFTDVPTIIQVGNALNDPSTYPYELNPGQVNVTNSVLLTQVVADSVSCAGLDDGSITLTVSGGAVPYTFTWNTFPPTGPENGPFTIATSGGSSTISNLSAGNYRILIADSEVPANLDTVIVEVFEGIELGVNLIPQSPTCNGASDGSITAQVTVGGVIQPNPDPLFTFNWSTTMLDISVLQNIPSGPYAVTVTDGNGCFATASATLSQPAPLQVLASNTFITNATCTGSENGAITVGATGGTSNTGNYTYAWSGGLGTVVAATSTVANLNPGSYTVTVTDNNGCTLTRTFTVAATKTLSINALVTDITCFGANDGQVEASGSATGAPPFGAFTYSWSNTQNTSTIMNLGPGSYILTLTDSDPAGCQAVDTFQVVQPEQLVVQALEIVNETCQGGGGDGSITLGVTGGTYPYSYSWSNTQTDSIAINLVEGSYTVDVQDANGCMAQATFPITAPTPPSIDQLDDDTLDCAGDTNGSLTVVASAGGAAISTFAWSNSASGATISGLSPGTYIVTVTAVDGCFSVDTAAVIAPAPLMLDSIVSNSPNCPGDDNGQLIVFVSGGTTPYTYNWPGQPPSGNNLLPGLSAGNYVVTVVDANNCPSITALGTVEDPPSIVITFSNIQSVSCFEGVCDGQATATAMYDDNSAGLFNFTWESGEMDMGALSSTATQLCKAEQTLVVTDDNGCFSTEVANIPNPDPITINASIDGVSCNGLANGSIALAPFGGTPGFTYFWAHSGETTATVSGLAAGAYNVEVTDANGCVQSQDLDVGEPDALILSVDENISRDVSCFGSEDGILAVQYNSNDMINQVGNSPYTWSSNVPIGSASPSSPVAQNLPAGTYSVTITDLEGCQDSLSFSIIEPAEIVAIVPDPEDPLCFNSTAKVFIDTIYGGAGTMLGDYQYMVDNNGILLPPSIPADIFGDGDHEVEIFDQNGCSTIVIVNIDQPEEILVTFPEDPFVVELGDTSRQLQPVITPLSTQVDSFRWSPAEYLSDPTVRNPFVRPLESLDYELTVIDVNGCEGVGSVFVELDANRNLYIPNAFSPNGDGANDEFRIYPCIGVTKILSVNIFNRWGDLVYQTEGADVSNGLYCSNGLVLWDGRFKDKTLNLGVYVYLIEVEFLDNVRLVYRGDVSLVR